MNEPSEVAGASGLARLRGGESSETGRTVDEIPSRVGSVLTVRYGLDGPYSSNEVPSGKEFHRKPPAKPFFAPLPLPLPRGTSSPAAMAAKEEPRVVRSC
jgi:hypothetical protein